MQRAPIELPSSEIAGLELSRYCQGQRRIARSLEANHLAGEGLAEVSHAHLAALGTSALPIAGALHTPQSPAMNSIARNLIVASIEDEAARRGGTSMALGPVRLPHVIASAAGATHVADRVCDMPRLAPAAPGLIDHAASADAPPCRWPPRAS
jgi:hypothetical protein